MLHRPAPWPPLPPNEIERIMGHISPPLPQLPILPRPLDMGCHADRQAYFAYEANREFDTWATGEVYTPTPPERLFINGGLVYIRKKTNEL